MSSSKGRAAPLNCEAPHHAGTSGIATKLSDVLHYAHGMRPHRPRSRASWLGLWGLLVALQPRVTVFNGLSEPRRRP